jgi:hypothetical protein
MRHLEKDPLYEKARGGYSLRTRRRKRKGRALRVWKCVNEQLCLECVDA